MLFKVKLIKGTTKWSSVCNQNKIDEMISQGYHVETIEPTSSVPHSNLPKDIINATKQ